MHSSPKKVVAVIQARTGSTRLPGKVLRPLGGRPVLGWMTRAARAASGVDDVVVATSTSTGDDAVARLAGDLGVGLVRGSEDDVLARFVLALRETGADAVLRLTADCPLVDPTLIDQVVSVWRSDPSLDYVATTLERTLPRGMDVEVASREALLAADAEAQSFHRTHVTSYLYAGERAFRAAGLVVAPRANDLRVTLDTVEDARLIEAIVGELGSDAPLRWRDVVDLLRARPELVALNEGVQQKALADG